MYEKKLPKISIVMPVLNRASTIEKAIQSVIAQDYPNIELIIIDGASTDDTVAVIKRYEKYISYWHSQYDGSATIAANFGIKKATGDLIAMLMADDWYEPGTFMKIGTAYLAFPDTDLITCGGRIVYLDKKSQQYKVHWQFDTAKSLKLSLYNVCFAASAICCRFITKKCYERLGQMLIYDDNGKHILSNDIDFLLRAVFASVKDVFVPHLGLTYFASKASSSFGNHRVIMMRFCEERMQMAERFLQNKSLSTLERLILHYWYIDQATRFLIFRMLEGRLRDVYVTFFTSMRKYHVYWLAGFAYSSLKIILKRSLRILRKTSIKY